MERALALLADARSTDHLIRELQSAADEGLSVVASSPFRVRTRATCAAWWTSSIRWTVPRSTRVLVRQTAVAAYHGRTVPKSYSLLAFDLADAADEVADRLAADDMAVEARPALLAVGAATGLVERTDELTAEVILAQARSVVVDLLMLTGLDQIESTDALPPPHDERAMSASMSDGPPAQSWVLHVDLDQFIAAVEVLRRPEAGRAAGGGRRPGDPTERGGGWRRRRTRPGSSGSGPGCRCGSRPASARTRCSCRPTTRRTTPPRPR